MSSVKKVAVILSGCGVYDGSEIHESVLTLLYLDKTGAEINVFAPDKEQHHVINHLTGEPVEGESRNVLVESARIARGDIKPLGELDVDKMDALLFPGGFGAAKNHSSFAFDGPGCTVDSEVERVIKEAVEKKKVIGTICISPAVTARALKDTDVHPKLTIGTDEATSNALKEMNAEPESKPVSEITIDEKNKIVSTPAYMLGTRVTEVATGIEKLVNKVIEMA